MIDDGHTSQRIQRNCIPSSKELGPGGSVVEGTAGNTGIGLSLVASFYGFKSVIVIPETQTEERVSSNVESMTTL